MRLKNKYLKQLISEIDVVSSKGTEYFKKILIERGIELNQDQDTHTLVNWDQFDRTYITKYDYEGCESDITKMLLNSALSSSNYVIIEMGYDMPVIRIKSTSYIANWYSFIEASAFMGATVIDDKNEFILEFSDDSESVLRSNFKIS